MTARTITVKLTDAQYRALGGAVALAELDWSEMDLSTEALNNAWDKINRAWHEKARR